MLRLPSLFVLMFGVVVTLGACAGAAPGEPCEASGEGFSRQDSCGGDNGRCLAFPITCPSGEEVTPNVCEGVECSTDDDCDDGWVCAATGSATKNCVPAEVCEG